MAKVEYSVAVHKAGLPMMAGESVHMFTRKLREQGSEFLMSKLSLDTNKASVFTVEVFASAAVFEVFKFEAKKQSERMRFFAVPFTRKAGNSGDFEFGASTEVERVTSFRAKPATTFTMKSLEPAKPESKIPGWEETVKSFWANAL